MFDAFNAWSRMMSAGWSMAQTGMRAAETMGAANEVVAARTALIRSAMHSPLTGDHVELGRMVPEKVEAFSRAGSATISAWWTAQSLWAVEMQHLGAMAMSGRLPTCVGIATFGERVATLGVESFEAAARLGSATLAPIHRKATDNARRLTRTAKRQTP